MASAPKKLDDLFHDTLKDVYFAEKKILTALPKSQFIEVEIEIDRAGPTNEPGKKPGSYPAAG